MKQFLPNQQTVLVAALAVAAMISGGRAGEPEEFNELQNQLEDSSCWDRARLP